MTRTILERALVPAGLMTSAGLIAVVARGALPAAPVAAVAPLGFLAVLTGLELAIGRWSPGARRLPRDLALFAAGGAVGALAQLPCTALSLSLGGAGFGPMAALPLPVAIPLGLAVADLAAYAVHRAFHAHPLLWRMHALHHAPRELYSLMSVVNAPLMVLVVRALPMLALIGCGFGPDVLFAYAVIDAWLGLCSHTGVDTRNPWLSAVVVTPEVHRLHHSARPEHSGNHALTLTLWDRVFGTFVEPRPNSEPPPVGLVEPHDLPDSWLGLLLLRPKRHR